MHDETYVVSFVENIFQFLGHVIVDADDGSVVKLHPDLALDVSDHSNPGAETNGDIDSEVLQRDQVLAVNAKNDLENKIFESFSRFGRQMEPHERFRVSKAQINC